MRCITQQCYPTTAPFVQQWKFIDIVTQNIFLGCGLNYRRDRIMPVMEHFQHFVLSTTRLILRSLRHITLSEPVGAFFSHGSDAQLISLTPGICLQTPSRNMSQATPASISDISWFDHPEQL